MPFRVFGSILCLPEPKPFLIADCGIGPPVCLPFCPNADFASVQAVAAIPAARPMKLRQWLLYLAPFAEAM